LSIGIGIPVRYMHAHNSVMELSFDAGGYLRRVHPAKAMESYTEHDISGYPIGYRMQSRIR
jgi:hypothetical protein